MNCYYRPVVIAIYDNGSKDGTRKWVEEWLVSDQNPWKYGVEFRFGKSDDDIGCARGTNAACEMVREFEYAIHLESDFTHIPAILSGEDPLWLRRAIEFMEEVGGNYMYLRRMVDENEMMMHWWSQWMSKISERRGRYMGCPDFWWSNNPALRRNKAIYDNGVLPLDDRMDGPKGTPGWSAPEMNAAKPGKAWIHQWGLFVHEMEKRSSEFFLSAGCVPGKTWGKSGCKYGFFKNGADAFCAKCDRSTGAEDMPNHELRYRSG